MGLNGNTRIFAGKSMDAALLLQVESGCAAVYTRRGPHKETVNEDALAVIPAPGGATVLVVADGVGGLPAGDAASAIAVQAIESSVQDADTGSLREAILDGIELANSRILDDGAGSATTLAVVEIRGNTLRSYHVGDAGVIVTGQRGRMRLQTVSHSPAGYALEAGLISEVEALDHEERNLVSNVVGSPDLRIEIGSLLRIAPRDTVVVASDGLLDNFLVEEIVEHVRCGELQLAANTLAEESIARMEGVDPGSVGGHPDDLSFVLYRPRLKSTVHGAIGNRLG